MTEQDIRAWEREIKHTQMMQEQREGRDLKEGRDGNKKSSALTTFEYLTMLTSEANNEINN